MFDSSESNLDARGRRKTSPAASEFYSRKILTIDDFDGAKESEINRIAKRLCRARTTGATSQELALRGRLVEKCMRFYYVSGTNVGVRDDGVRHEGAYAQIDDCFIDALMHTIDRYTSEGLFTHMLANQYANVRLSRAYGAAREDSFFGGSKTSSPILLDAPVRRNDDGKTTTVGELVRAYGCNELDEMGGEKEDGLAEADCREIVDVVDALEGEYCLLSMESDESLARISDDAVEGAILLRTLALITGFLGKSGRAANDTRKLYTRMFFSETLTRITKLRAESELLPLQRQEKGLFGAIEQPFQDSYTLEPCRTIAQLWAVGFVDGVPLARKPSNAETAEFESAFNYSWALPGKLYVQYLESLGKAASDALVSQQRSHYEELLNALRAKPHK